jgi:uncharacterized protein (TIGR02300 family)
MVMPEFGCKCVCVSCAARFYDMTRVPAICPKCQTAQPPPKPRAAYPASRAAPRTRQPMPVAAVIPAEAESDAELPEEVEEDDVDDVVEDIPEAEEV